MLEAPMLTATKKSHLMGIIFGFSEFVQNGIYALLIYTAACFLQDYIDERIKTPDSAI